MTQEFKEFVHDKKEDISILKEIIQERKAERQKKAAPRQRVFKYWNPDNHRQTWNGKGDRPDWFTDSAENDPTFIHPKNPDYGG